MSIADTVRAFADMVAAGAGIEDIAVCFGLTPLTVKRRLKLATVSPKLFALYRTGDMNMDQLIALALAETHEKQEGGRERRRLPGSRLAREHRRPPAQQQLRLISTAGGLLSAN